MNRISGPLLDRIDLQVEIEPVEFDAMADPAPTEPSAAIRERVLLAREIQQKRYKDLPGIYCNAQMNSRLLRQYAWPDAEGMAKLKERMTRLNMSARAFDRILRVARTIADLAGSEKVLTAHIAEAIAYRALDHPSDSSQQHLQQLFRESLSSGSGCIGCILRCFHLLGSFRQLRYGRAYGTQICRFK